MSKNPAQQISVRVYKRQRRGEVCVRRKQVGQDFDADIYHLFDGLRAIYAARQKTEKEIPNLVILARCQYDKASYCASAAEDNTGVVVADKREPKLGADKFVFRDSYQD